VETARLIGFFDGSRFVVVSVFAKNTEKTPRQELELAEARRQDYMSRRKEENERPD
jgi:phage-related protein